MLVLIDLRKNCISLLVLSGKCWNFLRNWKSSDEFNALLSRPVFNKLQKKLLAQMKYDMKMKEK